MEMYRALNGDEKRKVLRELVREYKEKCAYDYFNQKDKT